MIIINSKSNSNIDNNSHSINSNNNDIITISVILKYILFIVVKHGRHY
jgi:hypothetical protein